MSKIKLSQYSVDDLMSAMFSSTNTERISRFMYHDSHHAKISVVVTVHNAFPAGNPDVRTILRNFSGIHENILF